MSSRVNAPPDSLSANMPGGLQLSAISATHLVRAVAENQPGQNKNRMSFTSDFNSFTERLRRFFRAACGESFPIRQDRASDADFQGSCETSFNSLAMELFGLQFKYNTPYGRFCEARGAIPQKVKHWAEIPPLPTAAFKEFELTCLPARERTTVFYSRGTTKPRSSRHFHNSESLAIYEESPWALFLKKQKID